MAHLINDTRPAASGPVLTKQARDAGLTSDDARFALHRALHTTDPNERAAAVAWLARNEQTVADVVDERREKRQLWADLAALHRTIDAEEFAETPAGGRVLAILAKGMI